MPLESDLDLEDLPAVAARPEITVHIAANLPSLATGPDRRQEWRQPDGRVSLLLSRSESAYHLVVPGAAGCTISADGTELFGSVPTGRSTNALRHHLLNQALPRVLAHRGRLVLHASAVRGPSGVIALLGSTGVGKSTLAATFLAHGYGLVADDALVLERCGSQLMAVPDPRGVRLRPAAAKRVFARDLIDTAAQTDPGGKLRIASGPVSTPGPEPTRLVSAVLLDPTSEGDGIDVEPLLSATACMAFLEHSFHLDIWDRQRWSRRLRDFRSLTEAVPLSRVRFRQRYDDLTTLRDRILAHVTRESRGDTIS